MMNNAFLLTLQFTATLSCGLMAGVFFAFSTAVMPGLARLGPAQGILAMQFINRAILNPLFLIVFMGSAAFCALLLFTSLGRWQNSSAIFFLIGSILYLVGSFLVTVVVNVPLNNTLDALVPTNPDSAKHWASFLTTWTSWNHVRTIASLLATALLTLGLYLQAHKIG
jgi:uncharacterized membrane protein